MALTNQRIIALYKTHTLQEIAVMDGRSISSIRYILLGAGAKMRRKGPRGDAYATHKQWARDIDEGATYEDVARRYGVTKQAVHIAVKRLKERESV